MWWLLAMVAVVALGYWGYKKGWFNGGDGTAA